MTLSFQAKIHTFKILVRTLGIEAANDIKIQAFRKFSDIS